jgi:hypothetical protein
MSGGAIVAKPQRDQNLILLGIISADISPPEAFESFLVPGNSAASMLWPALGLGLTLATNEGPRPMLLAEVRSKLFDDRTENVDIVVQETEEFTEIYFNDERSYPPIKALLQMTKFPR